MDGVTSGLTGGSHAIAEVRVEQFIVVALPEWVDRAGCKVRAHEVISSAMDTNIFFLFIVSPRPLDSATIVPMDGGYQMSRIQQRHAQLMNMAKPSHAIIIAMPQSQSKALVSFQLFFLG